MRSRTSLFTCARIPTRIFVFLFLTACAFAGGPKEKAIWTFPAGTRSTLGLVADAAGNLYAAASYNTVSCPCGSAYQLSPPSTGDGEWTATELHVFQGGTDGGGPSGSLIIDKKGNLYGPSDYPDTIFELSPPTSPGGSWTETSLFTLDPSGMNGSTPWGRIAMDEDGNLYGTTLRGGLYGGGVVFELVAPKISGGFWQERILHNFGAGRDGIEPSTDLLLRGGILYGTTIGGGTGDKRNCLNSLCGTVFRLMRKPGAWTETILHSFNGNDGFGPHGGLVEDDAGNLYGTTFAGGASDLGTVYELSPPAVANDPWQATTLYNFTGKADGALPYAGLVRNKLGNLYGTGRAGGGAGQPGSVFELKPPSVPGGIWTFVIVHDFSYKRISDGLDPFSPLIFADGGIYGTTGGVVVSIVP
jgi:uncharacterized repeat protein (TIGR03803 family)